MAVEFDFRLIDAQRLAGRHPNGSLHDVDSGDHFGNAVFDLHPGVDFQHGIVAIGIHQEFNRGRAAVTSFPQQAGRGFGGLQPLHGIDRRSRRFFDQLLVAALAGAIPVKQVDGVAVGVTQTLHFHVPCLFEEFLDVHRTGAKGCQRFTGCRFNRTAKLRRFTHDPHATPPTTGRGFHDDRETNLLGHGHRFVHILNRVFRARENRRAHFAGQFLRADFVAQKPHGFR